MWASFDYPYIVSGDAHLRKIFEADLKKGMLGNNSFYIPDDTVSFAHDALHAEIQTTQAGHDDDHVYWDQFNEEHLYCGRITVEPAQVDQNYLYMAGGDFIIKRDEGVTKIESLVPIEAPGQTSNNLNVDGHVVQRDSQNGVHVSNLVVEDLYKQPRVFTWAKFRTSHYAGRTDSSGRRTSYILSLLR